MNRWRIPSSVVDIVKAVCQDYDRRDRAIKRPSEIDVSVLEEYKALNDIINHALECVECGMRATLLYDVCHNVGYDYTQISPFIAKNTYYDRKRRLIHDIAKGMHLV